MNTFSLDISLCKDKALNKDKLIKYINEGTSEILEFKSKTSNPEMFDKFQRYMISSTIDINWREHLYAMDQLREGIGLRAYGQKNPLIEYKKEGFGMFNQMIADIDKQILTRIFRTNIDRISNKQDNTSIIPKRINDDNSGHSISSTSIQRTEIIHLRNLVELINNSSARPGHPATPEYGYLK